VARCCSRGLHFPSGVAIDDDGNACVADYYNGRVLELPARS
jgi:hypothetical protein